MINDGFFSHFERKIEIQMAAQDKGGVGTQDRVTYRDEPGLYRQTYSAAHAYRRGLKVPLSLLSSGAPSSYIPSYNGLSAKAKDCGQLEYYNSDAVNAAPRVSITKQVLEAVRENPGARSPWIAKKIGASVMYVRVSLQILRKCGYARFNNGWHPVRDGYPKDHKDISYKKDLLRKQIIKYLSSNPKSRKIVMRDHIRSSGYAFGNRYFDNILTEMRRKKLIEADCFGYRKDYTVFWSATERGKEYAKRNY